MARIWPEDDGYTEVTPVNTVSFIANCPACGTLAVWQNTLWKYTKRRAARHGKFTTGPVHEKAETTINCKCEAENV